MIDPMQVVNEQLIVAHMVKAIWNSVPDDGNFSDQEMSILVGLSNKLADLILELHKAAAEMEDDGEHKRIIPADNWN